MRGKNNERGRRGHGETKNDAQLDELFQSYRAACPEIEPGAGFMPSIWQRIEGRQSFWLAFGRFGRMAATASAALVLLLLALNLFSTAPGAHMTASTYADALMADHSAERTYYTEAIRPTNAISPGTLTPSSGNDR